MAALAAADALAAAGAQVELLLPERGIGGGFAPLRHEGRALELGVRLLELAYEKAEPGDAVPPLSAYRPGFGAHRPFTPLVAAWAEELLGDDLVLAGAPRMLTGDRLGPDLFFATDATAIRTALDDETCAAVAREAAAAAERGGDAGPLAPERADALATTGLDAVSRACHGDTLHERLLDPYAAKVARGGTREVVAQLRRKVWIPLFWPRTLAEAASGATPAFSPHRPFHTVAGGGAWRVVEALRARLEASPRVTVRTVGRLTAIAPAGGAVDLTFAGADDTTVVRASRPVLGAAPGELLAAGGIALELERARSVMVWCEVAESDLAWRPSLLNVADADVPVIRISGGGATAPGRQILCAELPHDAEPDDRAVAHVRGVLERAGVIGEDAPLEFLKGAAAPTFPLPSFDNLARFAAARAAWDALELDVQLVGGLTDFGADSLNEQVVQALQTAEALA